MESLTSGAYVFSGGAWRSLDRRADGWIHGWIEIPLLGRSFCKHIKRARTERRGRLCFFLARTLPTPSARRRPPRGIRWPARRDILTGNGTEEDVNFQLSQGQRILEVKNANEHPTRYTYIVCTLVIGYIWHFLTE